jgi:hypothetical protein
MGDRKTMKLLLTLMFINLAALYAAFPSAPLPVTGNENVRVIHSEGDKELTWVDEHIQAILPSRVGISDAFIGSLVDPMKMTKAPSSTLLAPPKLGSINTLSLPKIVEEPLRLQALINKSALINGKWYKLSDPIRSYILSEIKPNSVLLIGKKEQKLVLFLNKQNSNIKITTK